MIKPIRMIIQFFSKVFELCQPISKLKNFKIKRFKGRPVNRPSKVTADAIYDIDEIRKYNRRRGIKSSIPVNTRNRKKKKKEGPVKVD